LVTTTPFLGQADIDSVIADSHIAMNLEFCMAAEELPCYTDHRGPL